VQPFSLKNSKRGFILKHYPIKNTDKSVENPGINLTIFVYPVCDSV